WQRVHQTGDDGTCLVEVGDVPQDVAEDEGGGAGEIQRPGSGPQDAVRVRDVGVDVVGGPLRGGAEQGTGVVLDHRVVGDVDDPALGGDALGHLVGVVGRRQAGSDVQELADARLGDQIRDVAAQKGPAAAGDGDDAGEDGGVRIAGLLVDGVVVLPSQPVVP